MKRKIYHHGNLRESLISAALKFLEKNPVEKLSLRTLALGAGVSQAAPYRHFKDREAVLAAIGQEGFELQFSYMMSAFEKYGNDPLELFHGFAQAYFHMGHAHPQHFKLMMSSGVCPSEEHPELLKSAAKSFALLKKMIVRCQDGKIIGAGDPYHKAMHCWSMVNGFTTLYAEGRLIWLGIDETNATKGLRTFVDQFRIGHSAPLLPDPSFKLFSTAESSKSLSQLKDGEMAIGEIKVKPSSKK